MDSQKDAPIWSINGVQNGDEIQQHGINGHIADEQIKHDHEGKTSDVTREELTKTEPQLNEDFKYGWFGWTPQWLQIFNRPVWLLVFLCIYSFLQVNHSILKR